MDPEPRSQFTQRVTCLVVLHQFELLPGAETPLDLTGSQRRPWTIASRQVNQLPDLSAPLDAVGVGYQELHHDPGTITCGTASAVCRSVTTGPPRHGDEPGEDETERREAGPPERLAPKQLREDQGAHGHHLIAHSGLRTKLY